MTPERWHQVKEILHEALQKEPGERSGFVGQACQTDPSLRLEVESLLTPGPGMAEDFLKSAPPDQDRILLTGGMRLGSYEIAKLIGVGGMGEVYRAYDPRLGRYVAIKVLPRAVATDPDCLRRFEQEARAAAALNHPNIVAIYDIGTSDQTIPYVVSELLDGQTLRESLRQGPLLGPKAVDLTLQIASGVAAAHEKGIIHRDLKPENLFVTKDGRIKILDFGLAKLIEPVAVEQSEPALADKAERGVVMGTLGYMAPEQVCARIADYRADIFALGAVMFEMFTGKRAFQGASSADTLSAILNEEPSFSCLSGNATPGLQRVISRCLEKKPEGRFQSAADLALAIRSLPEFSVPQTSALPGTLDVLPWIKWSALLVIAVVLLTWRFVRSNDVVPIHSIAVFPFANASKGSEMDYLGEGLSEEITNSLSRLPNLKVMARSTVSHYKLRQDDPQGVGRDLHVDAVLTGRVSERGNELEVETELLNVGTGTQLWGKRYSRSATDASLLQTAITRDIARYLRPQLSENLQEGLAKPVTKDAAAYQFYLRGRGRLESWTPEDLNAAAEFFEKAVAVDQNYAAAYAGLADVYAIKGYQGYVTGPELVQRARSAAVRALELDSLISEPHAALANVDLAYFGNFPEAEVEIQKALDLDPNSDYANKISCWIKIAVAKFQDGLADCRKALELDPLSLQNNVSLAFAFYFARDYKNAIEQANKTLTMDPKYSEAEGVLSFAYEQLGNYSQAAEHLINGRRLKGQEGRADELRHAFDNSGYRRFLKTYARIVEAEGFYYREAEAYAMLREKDAAFAALKKSLNSLNTRAAARNLKVDPRLDSLRSDPRFTDILRRTGLPQ